VKITPAHDFNDYDVGKRHNLPFVEMINEDGLITDVCEEFKVRFAKDWDGGDTLVKVVHMRSLVLANSPCEQQLQCRSQILYSIRIVSHLLNHFVLLLVHRG